MDTKIFIYSRNTYGYKIGGASEPSNETPGAFDIKFVDKNTTEMGAGKYTGDTPVEYFTPSSFCWGDTCDNEATRKDAGNIELFGIWVAKFKLSIFEQKLESMPSTSTTLYRRSTNIYYNPSSYFTKIQEQFNGNNGETNYGLNGNYDAHMIKNTEWGAFTYLSQSKYGKYGNNNYPSGSQKKIYINSNLSAKTGCSAWINPSPTATTGCDYTYEYKYKDQLFGIGASTTGTIYGIYDTSTIVSEFVMANYNNYSGKLNQYSYNSGFSGLLSDGSIKEDGVAWPNRRYYNLYTASAGIKGDATDLGRDIYSSYTDFEFPTVIILGL